MSIQNFRKIALSGAGSISNAIYALFRAKLIAHFLGPFGIGLFSQINQFIFVIANLFPLGAPTSAVRFIAESRAMKDEALEARYISSAFLIIFSVAFPVVIIGILFSGEIAGRILDSAEQKGYVIAALATYPLFMGYTFLRGLFRGWLAIKNYVLVGIITAAVSLFFLIPLLWWLQAWGAILSLTVFYAVGMGIALFFALPRLHRLVTHFTLRLSKLKPQLRDILKFGLGSVFAGISAQGAAFLGRIWVLQYITLAELGIFQAAFAIALQSTTFVLEALSTYVLPRLSFLQKGESIEKEYNQYIIFAVGTATPIIVLFLCIPELLLELLYSHKFLIAKPYLQVLLLGEFFRVLSWSSGSCLMPLKKLRAYISFEFSWAIIYILFVGFLAKSLTLMALVYGYSLSFGLIALARVIAMKRLTGLSIYRQTFGVIFGSLALICLTLYAMQTANWPLAAISVLAWLILMHQLIDLYKIAHQILKRPTKQK